MVRVMPLPSLPPPASETPSAASGAEATHARANGVGDSPQDDRLLRGLVVATDPGATLLLRRRLLPHFARLYVGSTPRARRRVLREHAPEVAILGASVWDRGVDLVLHDLKRFDAVATVVVLIEPPQSAASVTLLRKVGGELVRASTITLAKGALKSELWAWVAGVCATWRLATAS